MNVGAAAIRLPGEVMGPHLCSVAGRSPQGRTYTSAGLDFQLMELYSENSEESVNDQPTLSSWF